MRIYLLRHAERGYGKKNDSLTEEGIKQAKRTAKYFRKIKIDRMICGGLNRTRKTAEPLLSVIKCPVEYTSLVNEQSIGIFQGKSLEEYRKALEESDLSEEEFRPKKGENRHDAFRRVKQFIEQIKKETVRNLLVVSCSGFIADVITEFLKLSKEESKNLKIANCSISYLELDKDFNVLDSDINNISHLKKDSKKSSTI